MNKSLLISSQLFLPSIYFSLITYQYSLTCSLVTTYVGSSLFYIYNKENNLFHKIDLITARTTCIFNFIYTFIYIQPVYISFILLHNMALPYFISCMMYYNKNPLWYKMHIYFHIWANITAFIVIYEAYYQNQINNETCILHLRN